MTKPNRFKLLSIFCILVSTPTFSKAASGAEYEEVSYEQLVEEYQANQRSTYKQQQTASEFDNVRLHAGIGYINSFMNVVPAGSEVTEHSSGIQLSLGIDLFSPHWYSEGVFKNYGINTQGTRELRLREFDLKIGYTNTLKSVWSYSLSTGLSNRYLELKDPTRAINLNEKTPSLMIATGLKAQLNEYLSLGAEISAHSALTETADRNSMDLALRLTTTL